MKQIVTAFLSFSRVERLGFAVLSGLLLLLIIIRLTMSSWVSPPSLNTAEQARLNAAYLAWKESEASNNTVVAGADLPTEVTLFPFDPNTLDSAGFLRLGMPQRAVKSLMNWRRHNKHFYKPEDLKPLYNLPEDVYARLEPYIRIGTTNESDNSGNRYSFNNSFPAIPDIIDLNTADSALLDRGVPGIGATLSHKILQRRTALGGFIKHEQLLEVYKFPDTTFQKIKAKLRINPATVRKIDLNTATLAQMSAHPYIGEKVAANILMYRDGIKHYERVEQLRQVPLMNEEIYRKIAPYFKVD
jgi:DNA uptake protein ComE-like DNA-binding protein